MNRMGRTTWTVFAAGLFGLLAAGCSGWKVTTESSDILPRYTVRSMALVPFASITTPQVRDQGSPFYSTPQSIRQHDMSVAIPGDAEPPPRQAASVPVFAAERVTQLFWKRLQSRDGLHMVPLGDSVKASAADEVLARARPEAVAAAVARTLKADAALVGYVSMYQERVGSRLGANPAASVGFEVKVVAADGQVLWVGQYYERQRPLTEDVIGFIQRFGMFVTAEELAEYGVDEIMKEFPFGEGKSK
jgi:hypothetical protein